MKILIIQIVLIALVLALGWRMLRSSGQRTQAVRRLGLLAFALFAVLSILFPSVWTSIAHAVGVGRGTDLILYGLVVSFLSFVVTTYRRLRQVEERYTRLARRVALDEAWQHGRPGAHEPTPGTAPPTSSRDLPGLTAEGDAAAPSSGD